MTSISSRLSSAASGLTTWQRAMGYAVAAAGVGAATLAFGLWLGSSESQPQTTGLADAGPLTAWGLPISRLAVDVSAVGTVGMLVTGILLPRDHGGLSDAARRCLRSATWPALAWGVATAAMFLFSWSDVTGVPVTRLPITGVFANPDPFPEAMRYMLAAALAAVIAVGARVIDTTPGIVFMLLLTGYNLLPLTTLGHGTHHPIIGVALTVHVVAMALWVGGLAGLLIHLRRSPALLAVTVPRFSVLALACLAAVGISGLTAAWIGLGALPKLWQSGYGGVVMYKAEALVALGIIGWWHRRRTLPAIVGQRSQRAFARLAAAEVAIMVATVALGAALSNTPTPVPTSPASDSPASNPYAG